MTPKDLTREWHDVELDALEGGGESGHRTPFWAGLALGGLPHGQDEHPQTLANSEQWMRLHDAGSREGVEEIPHPNNMPARDGISLALRMAKIGWHRSVHAKTGGVGIFPMVKRAAVGSPAEKVIADAWERESSAPLHENQLHIVIDPLAPNGYRAEKQNELGEPTGTIDYHEHVERERKMEALNKEQAAEAKKQEAKALAEQPTARAPTPAGPTIARGN